MGCAEKAELSEMPSGVWTWVGPRNHVLSACPDSPPQGEGAVLEGNSRSIVKYREYPV